MKTNTKRPILLYKRIAFYSLLSVLVGIFLLPQIASLSSVSEEKIIALTNGERASAGIGALALNELLAEAAREKALSIMATQTFGHNIGERKFSDWIKEAGYGYAYAGENLAVDFVTGEGAIRAWMESETHRKNILNPEFSEIGVAVLDGGLEGKNTTLIVQIFGSPRPAVPVNASISSGEPTAADTAGASSAEEAKPGFLLCFDLIRENEYGYMSGYAAGMDSGGLEGASRYGREDNRILPDSHENTVKITGSLFAGNKDARGNGFSWPIVLAFGVFYAGTNMRGRGFLVTDKNKQLKLPLK